MYEKPTSRARKKRPLAEEKDSVTPEPTILQSLMMALFFVATFAIVMMGSMRLVVHGYYMQPELWQYDAMMIVGGLIIFLLSFVFMPRKK